MIPLNRAFAQAHMPPRKEDYHKGKLGTLSVVAGSERYRGAAMLAVGGALRAGAGLVRLAAIETVCAAVSVLYPSCTFLPLQCTAKGTVAPAELDLLLRLPSNVIAAGCGLENSADSAVFIENLLAEATTPLVLDADALNIIAGHTDLAQDSELRERCLKHLGRVPTIITPHIGEMARLARKPTHVVTANQEALAAGFARRHNCVVVLKSHKTVVAAPGGNSYIYDEGGNAGLAKGGSGDVLTGLIASLWAQGVLAEEAAALGVWLHAAAGEQLAREKGKISMLPSELPDALAKIMHTLYHTEK